MRALQLILVTALLAGCGGSTLQLSPADDPDGGKGTSVVNPVNPDKVFWKVRRGSQLAEAPMQAGDWVEIKCVECKDTTTWVTVWTLRDGQFYRTIYLDEPTAPFMALQIPFVEGEDQLMVLWSTQKLGAVPRNLKNLTWFDDPRRSPIRQNSQTIGELHWGPVFHSTQVKHMRRPISFARRM